MELQLFHAGKPTRRSSSPLWREARRYRIPGIVTDRGIVLEYVAAKPDPMAMTVGELTQDGIWHVEADAWIVRVARGLSLPA
ncbi:hypothetical protein [Prescottella agglutinans]|uniref:Uncharacterized protein n=1 Tax=Prescottella agglutinans TaxID=1644129 RepID=A0ABT6M6M3_9NOCA|nr:hypothetical protein [Prescottella agglutinans]MDH6279925.1 hypothetical protein [Prescottella agglutinans]